MEKIYRELLDQVKTELTERKCTVSENNYMLEFQRKSVGDGRKNTSLGELLHYIDLGVSLTEIKLEYPFHNSMHIHFCYAYPPVIELEGFEGVWESG